MTENNPVRKLAEDLMSHDSGMPDSQFEEFHMSLQKSVESLERRAHVVRRACFVAVGILIACYLAVIPMELFQLIRIAWVGAIWMACSWLALIATVGLLTAYWSKFRPALQHGRTEVQTAILLELQRQIAELSRRLDKQEP
jgi:hypothetical protein